MIECCKVCFFIFGQNTKVYTVYVFLLVEVSLYPGMSSYTPDRAGGQGIGNPGKENKYDKFNCIVFRFTKI